MRETIEVEWEMGACIAWSSGVADMAWIVVALQF